MIYIISQLYWQISKFIRHSVIYNLTLIIGGLGQTHIFAAKCDHCHLKTIFQSKWQFSSQMGERESSCLQILCVRFHRSHCLLYSRICKSPSSVFSGSHLIALYDSMSSLPPACLFSAYHSEPCIIIIIISSLSSLPSLSSLSSDSSLL